MIPYHDENDTVRPAVVTLGIIVICTLVWLFVQGGGAEYALAASVCNLGLIPGGGGTQRMRSVRRGVKQVRSAG